VTEPLVSQDALAICRRTLSALRFHVKPKGDQPRPLGPMLRWTPLQTPSGFCDQIVGVGTLLENGLPNGNLSSCAEKDCQTAIYFRPTSTKKKHSSHWLHVGGAYSSTPKCWRSTGIEKTCNSKCIDGPEFLYTTHDIYHYVNARILFERHNSKSARV